MMLGKPLIAILVTIFFNEIHASQVLTKMAIAAAPSTYGAGALGSLSASPSTRDLVLTFAAVAVELALFILVPIYLRSRRRAEIRSRIRILYDSRHESALAARVAQVRTDAPLVRPARSTRRTLRETGPAGTVLARMKSS